MANNPQPTLGNQSFGDHERLFHRVRRGNIGRNGKATFLAFALPDMSNNREQHSTPEEARRGFAPTDWGVVSFEVRDIPPRVEWIHIVDVFRLLPRHVPEPGNLSHSEVRVWRKAEEVFVLITTRNEGDFNDGDPDRGEPRGTAEELLDPDFHMRWRKHIALAAKMVLPPYVPDPETLE